MTSIRETCGCGSSIKVKHDPDPARIATDWRNTHPCDRRPGGEREVVSGAIAEIAHTEPHRTDTELGFHRSSDDTQPLRLPPPTRRDLREARP